MTVPSHNHLPCLPGGTDASPGQLASRGRRLGGALIDRVFEILGGILLSRGYCALTGATQSVLQILLLTLVPLAAQWYLIATRGQTLGKLVFRTRTVVSCGRKVNFSEGVAFREWPIAALKFAPAMITITSGLLTLITLLLLVDVMFIFGDERRCMHDRFAGTYVVDAK